MEKFVQTCFYSSQLNRQNTETQISSFKGLGLQAGVRSVWEPQTCRIWVALQRLTIPLDARFSTHACLHIKQLRAVANRFLS